MPYKQAVVEHLDNSDILTRRTGACNTIVRAKDGRRSDSILMCTALWPE